MIFFRQIFVPQVLESSRLRYVKSAKAATDVPTTVCDIPRTVAVYSLIMFHRSPSSSPNVVVGLTAPCLPPYMLQYSSSESGHLDRTSSARSSFKYVYHLSPTSHLPTNDVLKDRVHLQRSPAALHVDLTCKLLPGLLLRK